jgi:hypothetical protein
MDSQRTKKEQLDGGPSKNEQTADQPYENEELQEHHLHHPGSTFLSCWESSL